MGWHKRHWERVHRDGMVHNAGAVNKNNSYYMPLVVLGENPLTEKSPSRDIYIDNFIFPQHFFQRFINYVNDGLAITRTKEEIARIVSHSLLECAMPKGLSYTTNHNVLVDIHYHSASGETNSFGIYYIPIHRDRFDVLGGNPHARIVVVTVLDLPEKADKVIRGIRRQESS